MKNKRKRSRTPYVVFSAALGKFTATNNANAERASQRDYKIFDTREEAQAWARLMNGLDP